MAIITPEHQKKFDDIIDDIFKVADCTKTDSIIKALKELWEEIKSAGSE